MVPDIARVKSPQGAHRDEYKCCDFMSILFTILHSELSSHSFIKKVKRGAGVIEWGRALVFHATESSGVSHAAPENCWE